MSCTFINNSMYCNGQKSYNLFLPKRLLTAFDQRYYEKELQTYLAEILLWVLLIQIDLILKIMFFWIFINLSLKYRLNGFSITKFETSQIFENLKKKIYFGSTWICEPNSNVRT